MLAGCVYPWLCASVLGFGGMLLPEHPVKAEQNSRVMLALTRSILDNWAEITQAEYNIGGMLWAAQASHIARALGISYFPNLSDGHEEAIERLHSVFLRATSR